MEKTYFRQELKTDDDPWPVMEEMRRQGVLCDVVLRAEGRQFSAHRVVLASTFPYFRAMFSGDMVEARNKEIDLKGIDAIALEALVDYAYTRKIVLEVNNVQSIMMGANYLQLDTIRDACADSLLRVMDPQNALGLERLARFLGCTTVADAAAKYVEWNFRDVYKHEEYLALSVTEVEELLDKDNLWVEGEEQVFEACMLWVKHSADERKEHLPRLLALVRLALLTPAFIWNHVRMEALIQSSGQCRDLVEEAMAFHCAPESRRSSMPKSFRTNRRLYDVVDGYIYYVSIDSAVRYYDVRMNKTITATVAPELLSVPMITMFNGKLYIWDISGPVASVQVYDVVKHKWSTTSPMQSKRCCMGVVAHGDHIYVCGGRVENDGHSDLVERYHPGTDSWCRLAPMKTVRSYCAVISYLGFIYVLGGHKVWSTLASVERYDPVRNTWSEAPPMLTPRYLMGVAVLGGKLYACGGFADSLSAERTVEVLDPQTNKWTFVASMNTPLRRVTVEARMGKLWAVGVDEFDRFWITEAYDPDMNTWTIVSKVLK